MSAAPAASWAGVPRDRLLESWRVPALHLFDEVGSTNDVARRLAEAGAPAGTLVLAEAQTAGRGRRGRPWIAPAGTSILMSLVLRPVAAGDRTELGTLPLRIGLGAALAIEEAAGVTVSIKWPNDLLVGDRKIAGVLCEAALDPARGGYVVAGLGVNVGQSRAGLSAALPDAGSILSETGRVVDRVDLVRGILRRVTEHAARAEPLHGDVAALLAARDALAGRTVDLDGEPAGLACGLSADGALLVRRGENTTPIRSGTVRPTSTVR